MNNIPLPPRDPASQPNPLYVQMLNGALDVLWDGVGDRYDIFAFERSYFKEEYICLAVATGALDGTPRSGIRELQRLIEDRLGDAPFDTWADRQGVEDAPSVQAGRRAWILDLIEEFS